MTIKRGSIEEYELYDIDIGKIAFIIIKMTDFPNHIIGDLSVSLDYLVGECSNDQGREQNIQHFLGNEKRFRDGSTAYTEPMSMPSDGLLKKKKRGPIEKNGFLGKNPDF